MAIGEHSRAVLRCDRRIDGTLLFPTKTLRARADAIWGAHQAHMVFTLRLWPRLALTGSIGDDGVEEAATSPGIPCYVEGAQVQNALSDSILSRSAQDAWFCL